MRVMISVKWEKNCPISRRHRHVFVVPKYFIGDYIKGVISIVSLKKLVVGRQTKKSYMAYGLSHKVSEREKSQSYFFFIKLFEN